MYDGIPDESMQQLLGNGTTVPEDDATNPLIAHGLNVKVRRRLKVQLAHEDPENSSKLYYMHTQTKIPCTGNISIVYQNYTKEQNNNVPADCTIEALRCGILTRRLLMNSAGFPAVHMNILILRTRFPVLHIPLFLSCSKLVC